MAEWPFGKGVKPAIPVRWNYGGRHPLTSARVRQFSPFQILWLFAGGELGAWYDPSDLTTLYQDAAGTTSVTADGDPVGLMLDKSQGLVRGSDVVLNGDFSNGSTDWVIDPLASGTSWDLTGGSATIDGTQPSASDFYQIYTGEVGETFVIEFDVTAISGTLSAMARTADTNLSAGLTFTTTGRKQVIATLVSGTTLNVSFRALAGAAIEVDNISAKPLPGNHATQSVAASRRLYRTDGTLHWLEDDLLDDGIVASLPDLGANATLAYADGSGVTILEGQTISGDTNLPTVAQTYGVFYLNEPFNPDEEEAVTEYLNQLRGA